LINERLYRYLTLEDSVNIAYFLTISGKASKNLMKLLEVNFIKHRKAICMEPRYKDLVVAAYAINGYGSNLLFEAMKDPTIQVPGVDNKIPLMTKNNEHQELDDMNVATKFLESRH
jgi:hypothetical protein